MAGNTTNLYAGSARHYPIGRMPYPPAIADALGLEGSERLLDVGCGPGSLTLVLAPRVREAVGIDADADDAPRVDGDDTLPHPRPPHEAIAALVESYIGPPVKGKPWEDDGMRAAGFTGPERFEVDLRALLAATSPAGVFSERRREIALDVWR